MINDYPKNLYYMIDIVCNQRCTKCHHWKQKSFRDIDLDKLIFFINEIDTAKELCIVGGEPLIYSNEIVRIISSISNEIRVVLVTNGVLANKDFIDFIAHKNVHIVFSIDTINKEKWKFVRGQDSFDIVMENLRYAIKFLDKIQLSIQSVLAKETIEDCNEVDRFCNENGIYHSIQKYISSGFDGEWTPIDEKEESKNNEDESCVAYKYNLSIMPNGDIFTCFQQNLIPGCNKPVGNIKKTSFKEIINSEYLDTVINCMKKCDLTCKTLKCNVKENKE